MTDELMTASELADYLKVELRTVYRYLRELQLPAIRLGGRWRFRRGDIDQWLLQPHPLHAPKRQQPRILVVDDDDHFRSMVLDFLQAEGYDVQGAETGEAALALLREGTFELLLVDLRLPGMNGIELIHQAKRLNPRAHIIILTAYGAKESAIDALRLGVSDYLEKPLRNLGVLASTVNLTLRPLSDQPPDARRRALS